MLFQRFIIVPKSTSDHIAVLPGKLWWLPPHLSRSVRACMVWTHLPLTAPLTSVSLSWDSSGAQAASCLENFPSSCTPQPFLPGPSKVYQLPVTAQGSALMSLPQTGLPPPPSLGRPSLWINPCPPYLRDNLFVLFFAWTETSPAFSISVSPVPGKAPRA